MNSNIHLSHMSPGITPHLISTAIIKDEVSKISLAEGHALIVSPNTPNQFPKSALPCVFSTEELGMGGSVSTVGYFDSVGIKDHEYDYRYLMTVLSIAYYSPDIKERFKSVSKFAARVYVNWVSRNLAQRLGIPLEDKLKVDVVLAAYFLLDGDKPEELVSERREHHLINDIAEVTGHNTTSVLEILDHTYSGPKEDTFFELEHPITIDTVTTALKVISSELDMKVSDTTLGQICAGSWYGTGAAYQCLAALVERPIFMAMLYTSLKSPTFRRTRFNTLTNEYVIGRSKEKAERFTKTIEHIIRGLDIQEG